MEKNANNLDALNMTQIDAETEDGTVVISGNNVFASGKSVRVNVRSASVVSGLSIQTGISVSSCGNVSINNTGGTRSLDYKRTGCISSSCSDNVRVPCGETLTIGGSMSGNAEICENATLVCHGSCSGDVEIAEGGFFKCHGSMSGNITNNGGEYEIYGSFSGEVYDELDDDEGEEYEEDEDDEEEYDIDEDT